MPFNDFIPPSPTNNRILLVSTPRTASNLLLKILSLDTQPVHTNTSGGYFFYNAFMAAVKDGRTAKPWDEWSEEDRVEVQNVFQECLDDIEKVSGEAREKGRFMFAKEHAFWFVNPAAFGQQSSSSTAVKNGDGDAGKGIHLNIPDHYGPPTFTSANTTILPDPYLRTWTLSFIIRHPALAFPSLYRAMYKMSKSGIFPPEMLRSALETNLTLHWSRQLYDWGLEQGQKPFVLDANDVIQNPEVVRRFCRLVGLDEEKLRFEWDEKKTEANGEQRDAHKKSGDIMLSTLHASSGVLKTKAPDAIDVAVEAAGWKEEFGVEMGEVIEKAVYEAMPDYEYLKARRVMV